MHGSPERKKKKTKVLYFKTGMISEPLEKNCIQIHQPEEGMNISRDIQEYHYGYNTYMSNVWNSKRRVQASTQKP